MIPVLYPGNVLAPPAVLSAGAAAGFPVSRLADGDVGLLWQDSATGTRTLTIDQGAGGSQAVDTLLLAVGHNLAGVTVTVASGPTSGSLVTRASGAVPDATLYRLAVPVRTDRWWSVTFASTVAAPHVPELVLTRAVPFPSSPVLRSQEMGQRSTVIDLESYSGYEWNLVRGPVRWTASYPLVAMTAADRDALLAAHRALAGGARACYLTDVEGITRWVIWADRLLRFSSPLADRYDVVLAFREALGAP